MRKEQKIEFYLLLSSMKPCEWSSLDGWIHLSIVQKLWQHMNQQEKKSIVEITSCTEPCAFILNSVNTDVLKLDRLDALLM